MNKKIISFLLCLFMLISCLPIFAAESDESGFKLRVEAEDYTGISGEFVPWSEGGASNWYYMYEYVKIGTSD